MSYRFTGEAKEDLGNIVSYTRDKWEREQAIKYLDGVKDKAKLLVGHPHIGHDVSEYHEGLRATPYQSHVIYYVRHNSQIIIVRILHSNMLPSKHLTQISFE